MLTRGIWGIGVTLAALVFSCSSHSQELNAVAREYLQRHRVPCLLVLKVGIPEALGEVATCQDGREWALFWLEDEIAFVQPTTHELYKWDREVYLSYPALYGSTKAPAYSSQLANSP
jgi:hypothetical protein